MCKCDLLFIYFLSFSTFIFNYFHVLFVLGLALPSAPQFTRKHLLLKRHQLPLQINVALIPFHQLLPLTQVVISPLLLPLLVVLPLLTIHLGHGLNDLLPFQLVGLLPGWALNIPHKLRVIRLRLHHSLLVLFPLTLCFPVSAVVHLLLSFGNLFHL